MTEQERLHTDVTRLVEECRKEYGSPHEYATAILDLIRSRVEVVTPEMVLAWGVSPISATPQGYDADQIICDDFRAMLAAGALGRPKP